MGLPNGKWGVSYTLQVPVIKRAVVDFAQTADWTPASTDAAVSKDGGNFADSANTASFTGGSPTRGSAMVKLVLSATEMQCTSQIAVQMIDATTKAIEDQAAVIAIDYGIRSNTAQAGAASTITLDASASAVDNFYQGEFLELISGTGVGQIRRIASYVGSTKVATLSRAWATNPDNTSIFRIGFIASGDADATHVGGTSQTGGDIAARLPSTLVSGRMDSSVGAVASGVIAASSFASGAFDAVWTVTTRALSTTGVAAIWDALTSGVATSGSIGKRIVDYLTGDIFARLGAPAGASVSADIASAKADLTTLTGRLTAARAGYLDNLNVGGAVASNADIVALNQSASRRIVLTTVGHYERPESGSTVYTIEARTYDGDGASVNADSDPTLAVTGQTSGSLAANVSAITNPATGVYRWTYSQGSSATIEPIRVDVSAVIASSAFTLSAYTQSVDFVATHWTTTDQEHLTAVYNKLPSRAYLAGATAGTGAAVPADIGLASGNLDTQLAALQSDTDAIQTDVTTVLSRFGSFTGTGVNTLLGFLKALMSKSASTPSDVGGTFSAATDAVEAIRDRGDTAWTTGGGGGSGTESALMLSTTIASVTSQTVLVLTDGSPDNDAYNVGQIVVITDAVTAEQKARCLVSDYAVTGGGTIKTLTLAEAPIFTVAAGDSIAILAVGSTMSYTASNVVVVTSEDVTTASFPSTLNIGDSYDEDNALRLYLRDENDDPVTAAIGHNFTDGDFAPTLVISPGPGERGRVTATLTYVVPGGAAENYLNVEIPANQSKRAVAGVSTVQCVLKWGANVQKTLITTTVEWIQRL